MTAESTRFLSPEPKTAMPRRPRFDAQFFRADLTPGHEGVAGADPEAGQRFVSEIHYSNFFSRKLAEILAMQKLEFALVEDRDSQTAFAWSPTDQRWHGFIASSRVGFDEARNELLRR